MGVIAHEPHNTRVIVVVRRYLLYPISTCSAGVAGGIPVRMYALVVPRMAITDIQLGGGRGGGCVYRAREGPWCRSSFGREQQGKQQRTDQSHQDGSDLVVPFLILR